MTLLPILLVGGLLTVLLLLIVFLVARLLRGRTDTSALPLLVDVASRTNGTLACPVCLSSSFERSGDRRLFAIAFGPFIFGSIDPITSARIACVPCGTQFRQGLPTVVPMGVRSF